MHYAMQNIEETRNEKLVWKYYKSSLINVVADFERNVWSKNFDYTGINLFK